jgi:hypothetical protein
MGASVAREDACFSDEGAAPRGERARIVARNARTQLSRPALCKKEARESERDASLPRGGAPVHGSDARLHERGARLHNGGARLHERGAPLSPERGTFEADARAPAEEERATRGEEGAPSGSGRAKGAGAGANAAQRHGPAAQRRLLSFPSPGARAKSRATPAHARPGQGDARVRPAHSPAHELNGGGVGPPARGLEAACVESPG